MYFGTSYVALWVGFSDKLQLKRNIFNFCFRFTYKKQIWSFKECRYIMNVLTTTCLVLYFFFVSMSVVSNELELGP